jgi:hypothetical protein
MLESFRAIGFLKMSDAETPEDVDATLDVFHLFQDGVQAVSKGVIGGFGRRSLCETEARMCEGPRRL